MYILRDPALASSIADPDIRSLVEQRFAQVCEGKPYDYDQHGYMIVVEPGDTVQVGYLNPTAFLSFSVLAIAVVVFIYFHKRSTKNGIPKLPDQRD